MSEILTCKELILCFWCILAGKKEQTQKIILVGRRMELPCGLIYSWSFMATSLSCWFDSRVGSTVKRNFLHSHLQLHFEDPFKSQSPGDPCTVTEQFDVNQQASAVCLDCFWFACDHANSLFTFFFFFTFFLSVPLFYWLKFEFVRHSLWTGWMNALSGERRSVLFDFDHLLLIFKLNQ